MIRISRQFTGGMLASVGAVLTGVHLLEVPSYPMDPGQLVVAVLPLLLSVALTVAGIVTLLGYVVADRFAPRLLVWTVAGAIVESVLVLWIAAAPSASVSAAANPVTPLLNLGTFGALVGFLVGTYDIQRREQAESVRLLNRITDTLRIATRELVEKGDRDELEQAVCDRFSESEAYEAVWIGRYDEDAGEVRASAWAGFNDEYFESIVVTVDDTPTGSGAGGRAIKEREIQTVPDVFEDPSMEPWWELLETHGVRSLAVVPIAYGDTVYGFFSIYADRSTVFGPHEQEVLSEMGASIGHAITSIEEREQLADRETELARQNQRLEEFAGIVSHDLRNPLNVADGYLELVREDVDDERLARVNDALEHMDDLITELLTLARQGSMVDERTVVSLRNVVDDAWGTAGNSSASIHLPDELGEISCDPGRVRQLLENLFRNSIEHAGSDVTVTVRRTDDVVVIEDDGPGIPLDHRETVFDVGFSTNDDGTGFGLNIVRSIAEAHGWDVSVGESADGGTRFELHGVETA